LTHQEKKRRPGGYQPEKKKKVPRPGRGEKRTTIENPREVGGGKKKGKGVLYAGHREKKGTTPRLEKGERERKAPARHVSFPSEGKKRGPRPFFPCMGKKGGGKTRCS